MRKETKLFQAETKELLNLMIHSIYTNKEIFLRELISNASDAIDKIKFESLTNSDILGEEKDFKITISLDKEKKEITISDNGIGMSYDEVLENIGTIAKSGSKAFKEKLENISKDDVDIIGQFGVGFYSGFMVADKMTIITKSAKAEKGVKWCSTGDGSYEIEEMEKEERGTSIILTLKDNDEFINYLEEWKIKELVKKYSDYVRYPIYLSDEIINSSRPIWKMEKTSLTDEKYNEFYKNNFYDWEDPLCHFHLKVQGNVEYTALLYIPSKTPIDFYSKDYKKGLQLYTKNVFIMDRCEELLPEYFSFIKGLVDCDNLSLNISREILQQNNELTTISKNLEKKIITELERMLKNDRDKYIEFWNSFGKNIKFGIHDMFGMNKDKLKNLLVFRSLLEDKFVTLKEYTEKLGDKKEILYVVGEDLVTVKSLPKVEVLKEKNIDVLILTDNIDEFAIKTLGEFDGKTFKSINDSDFKLEEDSEKKKEIEKLASENKTLLEVIKEKLGGKVVDVELNSNLGNVPVSLLAKGEISLEMEKVLSQIPGNENIKAEKILAINPEHTMFKKLQELQDKEKFEDLLNVLYTEALLIEGFEIENPVEFVKKLNSLII